MVMLETPALVTKLPEDNVWEYGGHAYGLEPLALPARWLSRTATGDRAGIAACRVQLNNLSPTALRDLRPVGADEVDRMFWFRWITGHQSTFLLWQMLAAILDDVEAPEAAAEELAAQARLLVRGYSLMLIYTSSPTREIYHRVIRGPISRQHVNLSGAWARDYLPVRQLIRGKVSFGSGLEAERLYRECEINEQVHQGIADKVVPSGVSLLQSPKPAGGRWRMHRDTLLWLYDGIFLTSRTAVSYEQVVMQLVRRLHAIILDVMANGLYPSFASSRHEEPPILQTGELMDRKRILTSTLMEIIDFVGALVPEGSQSPATP